eukprot:scaffold243033_cov15-Prasinocladus_malaysianus.AAC.1
MAVHDGVLLIDCSHQTTADLRRQPAQGGIGDDTPLRPHYHPIRQSCNYIRYLNHTTVRAVRSRIVSSRDLVQSPN